MGFASRSKREVTIINEQEYLDQRLEDQIEWYDSKSVKAQNNYKRLRMAEMVFSASIPILVTFWNNSKWISTTVAILGACITIFAGIHGLYNFQENWIEYRSTAEILKHEKYMYLTKSGIYAEEKTDFKQLVDRVESIISHENINWAQLNSAKKSKSSDG